MAGTLLALLPLLLEEEEEEGDPGDGLEEREGGVG